AEKVFFDVVLPPIQKLAGLSSSGRFAFEKPEALANLKERYRLDRVISEARDDFESAILLMHWVRDQFPHAIPAKNPPSQAFDGYEVLRGKRDGEGFLCGTASQLLIQAITSVGGYARRVELRFQPADAHAVVEAWSSGHDKWFILDPDYDIYYTLGDNPQNAAELHRLWAEKRVAEVTVHDRPSRHNIYHKELEGVDGNGRFSVKLLSFYNQISYPLRNDWASRPLPWWHPEGNHVQNSAVILHPTMPDYEDFTVRLPSGDELYQTPKSL
ncbi:MAG: transglutaminase-like domain-containing protein, partial [Deltaproteobacteria bacterium]|nr:transglutaminase-like domain-containing protein [Deltaproteobacteria bacterium]